jgi:hypothetical protein
MKPPRMPNSRPIIPSAAQVDRTNRPPGRSTRVSSRAVTAWRGANIRPNVEVAASKLPS